MIKQMVGSRLLLGILLPVAVIGFAMSIVLTQLLLPKIISVLQQRTDTTLKYATDIAMTICEERLSDILELRMEDNPEMNASSKRVAVEQIQNISVMIPGIHMLVLDKANKIIGSSHKYQTGRIVQLELPRSKDAIAVGEIEGQRIRINRQFFPYWNWDIVSCMVEKDYMGPVLIAKWVVYSGTIGVLCVILFFLVVLVIWRINLPLKRMIAATEEIQKGNLTPVQVAGNDEITKVSLAFNAMVKSLTDDKHQIDDILERLKQSEELYRVLTESSLTNIAMIQDNRFVFGNKMMLTSLVHDESSFIGKKYWDTIYPEDAQRVKKRMDDLVSGSNRSDHFECRVMTKSGQVLWLELMATLIEYQEGNMIMIPKRLLSRRFENQVSGLLQLSRIC